MFGRRRFLFQLGSSFTIVSAGCGTVLHNERIGQQHSNQIDWEVAALNGLGLAFFFVPGVIAFVVDFYNGTIYLPTSSTRVASHRASEESQAGSATQSVVNSARDLVIGAAEGSATTLRRVLLLDQDQPSAESIEQQVDHETGHQVSLQDDETRVSALAELGEFGERLAMHEADANFGIPADAFFT